MAVQVEEEEEQMTNLLMKRIAELESQVASLKDNEEVQINNYSVSILQPKGRDIEDILFKRCVIMSLIYNMNAVRVHTRKTS